MVPGEKTDPRIARTHAAIISAFLELACEPETGKISVKAITDRAGINRKTFYLHFESIEALFDEVMNNVMDDFFEHYETTPDIPEDLDGHARRFFLFMAGQPAPIEQLVCSPRFAEFGRQVYREQMSRYRSVGDPFDWMNPGEKELLLHFIRTTALDFYRAWVRYGKTVSPDCAANLLAQITCHGASGFMR